MCEVYLFGMISASTVYILDNRFSFPKPNEYAEISRAIPSIGGEAVNSAIMLSKLGIKTKLDGNWLGERNSEKILALLKPFDIDTSRLSVRKNYTGAEEIVIIDQSTRTIFGNYANLHSGGVQWNEPQEIDIKSAKMIALDPYFKKQSLSVAEMCVKNDKPYVVVDSKYDDFMAQNAEAIIISHELRDMAYKDCDAAETFNSYQKHCKGLIVFTFGADELWFARGMNKIKKLRPYKINPIDTTGAGDSFRSGVIYGLLNNWDDESTVEFASAVSACVCLSVPHTLNAPNLEGVLQFMKENE